MTSGSHILISVDNDETIDDIKEKVFEKLEINT